MCRILVPWPGFVAHPVQWTVETWSPNCWTTREVHKYGIILSSSKESFGILLLFIENLKIWKHWLIYKIFNFSSKESLSLFIENLKIWKHWLIYKIFNFLILCLGMSCQLLKPSLYLSIFMQMSNYFYYIYIYIF